jgi:hypothetical protein
MANDAQYLDALSELATEVREAFNDVDLALEHRTITPVRAALICFSRVHSSLKKVTEKLGPDWRL